jgi:hypothetical protein
MIYQQPKEKATLGNLIKALQILLKYRDPEWPTSCDGDIMFINGVNSDDVSDEDKKRLDDLGFKVNGDGFLSYWYG